MKAQTLRSLVLAVVACGAPAALVAQRPTTAQAQQLLQNPALLEQLRQRIATSGLTPDQVRARLRAEGYPENLLDAYIGGPGSGATSSGVPAADVFSAVRKLGIADSTDLDLFQCGIDADTVSLGDTLSLPDTSGLLGAGSGAAASARARLAQRKRLLQQGCAGRAGNADAGPVITQAERDSGFVIFGLEFFRRQTSQFAANQSGPVDPGYRLGPGDNLVLVLTGDVEQAYELPVTREGFIVIPQVGEVYVNNLTLAQLETVLYTRLRRVYSGVSRGPGATTRFSVTPSRLRSNQIYVVGDVLRPGSYRVSSAGTALTALYAAGGPSDNGSLRSVEVRRGGRTVEALDVYDYLVKGDASRDVRLQNGDIVFVPPHLARARIVGEIARPATYEIKPTETLADALRFAGGFTATASRRRVQIERIVPPSERTAAGRERVVTDIVSEQFVTGVGPSVPVQPGDVIRVFAVTARVRNRIAVAGNVYAPGTQGLAPGMRVSDALRLAGGVRPDTYLGELLVTRLQADSTRLQLRAALRDTTGAVINDFQLQEDDEIRVFSTAEFRPARYVAINGAVRRSGQVPYREGMTVRDLVLLAGGLEQSAYLNEAEIARLPESRAAGVTARTFRVPLDSSYLFERGPDGHYFGPPGLPAPSGPTPEVTLRPYDNVLILRQPNWELQRNVVVTGEVRFPGRYALVSKTERVSDILTRAGGLTREGYANGVTFYRATNGIGRVGIQLPDVLRNPRDRDNLLLMDGDSINIPRFSAIVNVAGAVNSPVAVTYRPGADVSYYIRSAGGPARKADVARTYVTQPNGTVDARSSRFLVPDYIPRPQPGSTVFVPERADQPVSLLTTIPLIAPLLSTLVTLAVVLVRRP